MQKNWEEEYEKKYERIPYVDAFFFIIIIGTFLWNLGLIIRHWEYIPYKTWTALTFAGVYLMVGFVLYLVRKYKWW